MSSSAVITEAFCDSLIKKDSAGLLVRLAPLNTGQPWCDGVDGLLIIGLEDYKELAVRA